MPEPLDLDDLKGHVYIIGASLEFNEPLIYKKDGTVRIGKIGEIVDKYYEGATGQTDFIEATDIEVVSFDKDTFEVEWTPISYVYRHKYKGKLLKFRLQTGREITVTPDHSLFVIRRGVIEKSHASEIRPGDFVIGTRAIPTNATTNRKIDVLELLKKEEGSEFDTDFWLHDVPVDVFGRIRDNLEFTENEIRAKFPGWPTWRVKKYLPASFLSSLTEDEKSDIKIGYWSKMKPLPTSLEVDEALARLLGYYVAEGSADRFEHRRYRVSFNFGPADARIIEDTISILDTKFGLSVAPRKDGRSKGVKVEVHSRTFYDLMVSLAGRGAADKFVPAVILSSPQNVRTAYFIAWEKGDWGVTVSRRLASDVSYLLLQEGCVSTVSHTKGSRLTINGVETVGRPSYHIEFPRPTDVVASGNWRKVRGRDEPILPTAALPNPMSHIFDSLDQRKMKRVKESVLFAIHEKVLKLKSYDDMLVSDDRLKFDSAFHHYKDVFFVQNGGRIHANPVLIRLTDEMDVVDRLTKSNLAFLEVKSVSTVESSRPYVYDVSVPGRENFLGGFGGVFASNTRSGKSNALLYIMDYLAKDSVQKRLPSAIIFLDPHGEASFDLATRIPNIKRLFIFDPSYVSFALNPLELAPYKTKEEKSYLMQSQVAELATILKELFGTDTENSPRLMWIFRSALYFLFSISDEPPTFADLYALLSDMIARDADELSEMLRSVGVEDELITKTIEAITKLESAAFTSVLNRISNFVMPPESLTSKTFCSRRSTLPFEEMMKPGSVTIFRLSKFHLPSDFRVMVTNTVLLKFYFMIQKRARDAEKSGQPLVSNTVNMVIDEFQNIGSLDTIDSVLSEAAKYGLYLTMAHQNTAQLRPELFETIMGNVGLVMSFRVGPEDAKKLARLMDASKSKEIETMLPRLPNWVCLVRKNPVGGRGLSNVLRVKFKKVHEPVRSVNDVIEYMRNVMNPAYGNAIQDLKPIYKDKLEDMRRAQGQPVVSPLQWGIMTKLFVQHEITHTEMVHQLYNENYWDGSVVQGGLTYMQELGYISAFVTTDPDKRGGGWNILSKQNRGEMPNMKPGPKAQDELDRSREVIYRLSEDAKNKFFRTQPRGRRGGGPLHQLMMSVLLNEYWQGGRWVTVDTGDVGGEKPDMLVFSPKEKIDRNKRAVDPLNWDKSPFAVEIETYPEKSQEQARHNLEKNVKKGYKKVLFVVSSPEHRIQLDRILRDMGYPYEIKTLNLYEDPETYKKYLNDEMRFIGEEGQAEYSEAANWKPPAKAEEQAQPVPEVPVAKPVEAPIEKPTAEEEPVATEEKHTKTALEAMDRLTSEIRSAVEAGDTKKALDLMVSAVDILGPLEGDTSPEAESVRAKWREFGASQVTLTPELREALTGQPAQAQPPPGVQKDIIKPDTTISDNIEPIPANGGQNTPVLNNAPVLSAEELARQNEEKDRQFRKEIIEQLARTPNVPRYKLAKLLGTSEKRLEKHLEFLMAPERRIVIESGGAYRLDDRFLQQSRS